MTKEQQKKIKEMSDKMNFGHLEGILKKAMDGQLEQANKLKAVLEEHKKMSIPKSTKTVKINGKDCVLALQQDGKVTVTLPSMDDAEILYSEFNLMDREESKRISIEFLRRDKKISDQMDEIIDLTNKLCAEIKKKWYHKLFGK